MHLDRAAFRRRLLVLPAATLPSARLYVANAAAPPVLSGGEQFYQSDDKLWDVVLPKEKLDGGARADPLALFERLQRKGREERKVRST